MLRNVVVGKGAWVGRASSMVFGLALVVIALILALVGCSNGEQAQSDPSTSNETTQSPTEKTAYGDSTTATTAAV